MKDKIPFEILNESEFEAFLERVGICQQEGNLSIEEAQKVAYEEIVKSRVGLTSANLNYSSDVKLISAKNLQEKEFPPQNWIVENTIAQDVTILASKPKIGKTWLSINFAFSVCLGESSLGKFNTTKTNVLYLNLDDPVRRFQNRIKKIINSGYYSVTEAPDNFYVLEDMNFPKLNTGGLQQLEGIVDDKEIGYVIVDTFELSITRKNLASEHSYGENYNLINKLKQFAYDKKIGLLLIHHSKKEFTEDVFSEILGSTGLFAGVDTGMVLRQKGGNHELHFKGNDVVADELDIKFDKDKGIWLTKEKSYDIDTTPERMEIIKLLAKEGRKMKTDEIAEKLGKSKSNISNILGKMAKEDIIKNPKFGYYSL